MPTKRRGASGLAVLPVPGSPSPATNAAGFATRLTRLRKAAGLTQTELAGDDLSPSYVSLLESGKRQPSAAVVQLLASRLGCSSSMLWEGEHSERERRLALELSYARLALTHGGLLDARDRLIALLAESDLDQRRRDEATLLLGSALERTGAFDQAIDLLTPLFTRSVTGDSHIPPSTVGAKLCFCNLHIGDVYRAVSIGQEALDAAVTQGLSGTEEYYRLGATLLWGHHELGNLSHARAWAEQLIAEAEQNLGTPGGAAIYWNAALLADSMGEVSEALHLSERALTHYTESDTSRELVMLRLTLADIQLRAGPEDARRAMATLEIAKANLADLGSVVDEANWECLAAHAALVLDDLDAAQGHAAAAQAKTVGLDHEIAVDAQIIVGDVAIAGGDRDEALARYRAAVDLLAGQKPRRGLVRLWRELGDRLHDVAVHDLAAHCYEQALTTARIPDRSAPLRALIFRAARASHVPTG